MYHLATFDSPLGKLLLGTTEDGICLLEFTDQITRVEEQSGLLEKRGLRLDSGGHPFLNDLQAELKAYFEGKLRVFSLPFDLGGSDFQRRVWQALRSIPYGETRSYRQLAVDLGQPGGSRAVGSANGSNPVAIMIPCHRVITANGKLGGYGGGLWRKEWLLNFEGRLAGTRLGI